MKRKAFIKKTGFAGKILLVDPAGKLSSMPDDLEAMKEIGIRSGWNTIPV